MVDKPEGARDDAGRTDDSPGFDVQARMFTGIGAFAFFISIVYGFISKEAAGTTMLVLTGGLAMLTGAYLGLHKPPPEADVEDSTDDFADEVEEPWFPHASIWPFTIGAGAMLVANGILLGLWMLLPAGFVLAGAIIGFSRQSRQRVS
jgi:hypothetical protein